MPVYEKKTTSGDVLEIEYYHADPVRTESGRRCTEPKLRHPSSETQKAKNKRRAEKNKIQLFNNNFNWKNAHYATLTVEGISPTMNQVIRIMDNFIKCLRRKYPGMKWIYVVGQKNKERIHVHMVTAGADPQFIHQKWKYGRIKKIVALYRYNYKKDGTNCGADYIGLATYFLEHCKKGKSQWHQSRNLQRPEKEVKARKYNKHTIPTVPDGYVLIDQDTNNQEYTGTYRYYKFVKLVH